jgi:hypothetical protein
MANEKQIQANRRNAQRSTGPVTPAGKAASSRNAFKHGLRSHTPIAPATEEELQRLHDHFAAAWQPQTEAERMMVEQLTLLAHQRLFLNRLEGEWDMRMFDDEYLPALEILSRRQAALHRRYYQVFSSLLEIRLSRPAAPRAQPGSQKEK